MVTVFDMVVGLTIVSFIIGLPIWIGLWWTDRTAMHSFQQHERRVRERN